MGEANCSFRRVNVTRSRDCLDVSRNNIEGWEMKGRGEWGCVNYEELVRAGNKSYVGLTGARSRHRCTPLADLKCVRACRGYFRIRIQECIGRDEGEFRLSINSMTFQYLACPLKVRLFRLKSTYLFELGRIQPIIDTCYSTVLNKCVNLRDTSI